MGDLEKFSAVGQQPLAGFVGIVRRPRMYTMNGTYEEIIAYISGTGFPVHADDRQAWQEFNEWLLNDMGLSETWAIRDFRKRFTDDESAKQGLLEKLAEFRKTLTTQTDPSEI
jgi:hypothetical protein